MSSPFVLFKFLEPERSITPVDNADNARKQGKKHHLQLYHILLQRQSNKQYLIS